jgi:hypothetical protein
MRDRNFAGLPPPLKGFGIILVRVPEFAALTPVFNQPRLSALRMEQYER